MLCIIREILNIGNDNVFIETGNEYKMTAIEIKRCLSLQLKTPDTEAGALFLLCRDGRILIFSPATSKIETPCYIFTNTRGNMKCSKKHVKDVFCT